MRSWLCGLCAWAVYLLWPNRDYSYDAVTYAEAARSAADLLHPHHLLYNAFGRLLVLGARPFGGADAIALLRSANGLAMAMMTAILCALGRRLTGRAGLGWACALVGAFSYGVWYAGTSVEAYPIMLLLVCAAAGLALWGRGRDAGGLWIAAGAGLLTGVAATFHQTGILFVPVLCALLWRPGSLGPPALAAGAAGAAAALPYLVAAHELHLAGPRALLRWVFFYTTLPQYQSGDWGGGLAFGKLPLAALGLGSVVSYPAYVDAFAGASALSAADLIGTALLGVFAAALVTLMVIALRRPAPAAPRWAARALALWVLIYGGFTLWWDPGNHEFWTALVPPLVLLLGLLLGRLAPSSRAARLGVPLLCASLFGANLLLRVYPDARPERNAALQLLGALVPLRPGPEDLVLSNLNHLIPYGRYFWGRPLQVASLAEVRYDAPDGKPAALLAFRERIERARESHAVYLSEMELRPMAAQLYTMTRWSPADLRALYEPYLGAAEVAATFRAYGRAWRIYRLR